MISVEASRPFLTSSSASCKSKVQANKRRINGRGCLTQTVRIDPRWTPRLAIPPRARTRPHRDRGNRFGHRRIAPRMPHRNRRARLLRPHQSAARSAGRRHRAGRSLRAAGCRRCLLPPLRRRCRRATGAPALGALRAQRRTRPQSGRSIDSRRRLRPGGHGSGRYAARHRAPHLAGFLVPPAPRRGTYTGHAGFPGAAIQRQDLRVAGDRVRPPRGNLVRRAFRLPPAARDRGARSIHTSEEAMFACLHGTGNLTALAFEFSPSVEATAPDTVTFDVSGLDRIFGLPQDIAGTIARRAREIGVKANLALAGNPDAAICAARGFSGVSLIPHGDEGKFLADGPCTENGELALGRNVLVAFMPWRGYNFEDAIVVSEKLVKDDYYTSIHIEEFEVDGRDTKLGPEEITRDIPNINETFLRNLDESGIIRIGATVKPGDILVGKVTPKGETQLTPEEKLLRAIFGEKAGDVKDASLYCPPGIEGTIVDCKIFSRKGQEKDERSKSIEESQIQRLQRNLQDEIRILTDERAKRLTAQLDGKKLLADLHDEKTNKRLLSKDTELNREIIEKMKSRDLKRMRLTNKDPRLNEQIDEIEEMTSRQIAVLEKITDEKVAKLRKGDELPPGVIKLVKVYIAMKRKLSVGDKLPGRHGNKGVIARILPDEDMPYLPDGTPVEIVLNPLGVPSRMNVGQILETHLGWAGWKLGEK